MTSGDWRRPILCAVTDRRRLRDFPSVGAAIDGLVRQARAAADAGLDLFQIREPDLPDIAILEIATRACEASTGSALRVLVNDRLDIAVAAHAHGVHLRASSYPAARARLVLRHDTGAGPFATRPSVVQSDRPDQPFVIGRSVHSVDEAVVAERAGGLDYLILGTMFPTLSKPAGHPLAGVEALGAAVRACRLPVLAIGGVDLENAAIVASAGAAGLAAIGLFLGDPRRLPVTASLLRQIFAASGQSA